MVCINIEFTNTTGFPFKIENANGSWKSWSGSKTVKRKSRGHVIKLRPQTGMFGVEKGIQGSFNLVFRDRKGDEIVIAYKVDFPAAGGDKFEANCMEAALVQTNLTDNGKYGPDNAHNLKSQIGYTGKMAQHMSKHAAKDDTADWFRDIGTEGLKIGIAAALA